MTVPVRTLPFVAPGPVRVEVQRFDGEHFNVRAGLHAHAFLEVLLLDRGAGHHLHDGVHQRLTVGDVVAIAPGQVHECSALGSAEGWLVLFCADAVSRGSVLSSFGADPRWTAFRTQGMSPRPLRLGLGDVSRLSRRIDDIRLELDQPGPGHEMAVAAHLDLLLLDLAGQAEAQHGVVRAAPDPLVQAVLELVEDGYAGPLSLATIARRLDRSASYVTGRVRRATGQTVQQWIIERRLQEARHLLLRTDRTVAAVAAAAGYVDVAHFTRHFTRAHGQSPGSWRRAARAMAGSPRFVADSH